MAEGSAPLEPNLALQAVANATGVPWLLQLAGEEEGSVRRLPSFELLRSEDLSCRSACAHSTAPSPQGGKLRMAYLFRPAAAEGKATGKPAYRLCRRPI